MTSPDNPNPGRANPAGPTSAQDPFVRYNARILDPTTAGKLTDGSPASLTAYVSNRLIVTADTREDALELLANIDDAADAGPLRRRPDNPFDRREGDGAEVAAHNELAELLALAVETGTPVCFPVVFESVTEQDAAPAPEDVWPFLRLLRRRGTDRRDDAGEIGLDHLMFAGANILGNPVHPVATAFVSGNPVHPVATSEGIDSYTQPGFGGHGPVAVVWPAPEPSGEYAPHVVVLDTGVGEHEWFQPPHRPVNSSMTLADGRFVGMDVTDLAVRQTDPEGDGAVPDRMTGLLASHAGHGTFISGLLRQTCPDAEITALRIMDADGAVTEWELARSVMSLGIKQKQQPGGIDALVLSLGYYAETGKDLRYTAGLKRLLLHLARNGVVTFAAAGNDCTELPSYPAAFAIDPAFESTLPLVSVAALNPDGTTVAMFSNDGDWVTGEAIGANVVSTAPAFAQGSYQSVLATVGPGRRRRSTIDPDDYSGGFATWSGTSFATPILAGQYLHRLVEEKYSTDVSRRRSYVPPRQ